MVTREDFRRDDEKCGTVYTLWPKPGLRWMVGWIEVHLLQRLRTSKARAVVFYLSDSDEGHDTDSETLDSPEEAEAWAIGRVNDRPARLAFAALETAFVELAPIMEHALPAIERERVDAVAAERAAIRVEIETLLCKVESRAAGEFEQPAAHSGMRHATEIRELLAWLDARSKGEVT